MELYVREKQAALKRPARMSASTQFPFFFLIRTSSFFLNMALNESILSYSEHFDEKWKNRVTLEDSISFQTRIIISVRKDKILRQIQENSHLYAWNADRDISDPNFPLGRSSTLKKMTNLTYKYKKPQRPQSVCKPRKLNIHISHKIKMRHENNWKEHYENKSSKTHRELCNILPMPNLVRGLFQPMGQDLPP